MGMWLKQIVEVFAVLSMAAVPSLVAASPARVNADSSDTVELQVNVCDNIGTVLTQLDLERDDAVKRETYLFESAKFELIDAHLTIRLRLEDDEPELAVKKSNLAASEMARWQKLGADCEYDDHFENGIEQLSGACKVLKLLDEQTIRGLKRGTLHVADVLSAQQLRLLELSAQDVSSRVLANVRILGPLKEHVWKSKEEGFDKKITLEESVAPTGRAFLELSTRTTLANQARTAKKLKVWLAENEITLCAEQSGQRRKKLQELFR